jgi:hypothetical protein
MVPHDQQLEVASPDTINDDLDSAFAIVVHRTGLPYKIRGGRFARPWRFNRGTGRGPVTPLLRRFGVAQPFSAAIISQLLDGFSR